MTKYRGRFAPSPSGPLHFGSLVAALGSWLDARHHQGEWLVRIEDIDPPREIPGATDDILHTLEKYGLTWDQQVSYQSTHLDFYQQVIEQLIEQDLVYRCTCTRRQIQSTGGTYTNLCRTQQHPASIEHSLRLKVINPVFDFEDCFQGMCNIDGISANEDFIIKRKDGLFAYMLAVVIDDIRQHITHVIRGADLLNTTTQQLYLFKCLKTRPPVYGHLPLAVNLQGMKLSKQNHAQALSMVNISETLWYALAFLKQNPPQTMQKEHSEVLLEWAVQNWKPESFAKNQQFIYEDI